MKTTCRYVRFCLIHSITALLIGVAIYIFFREHTYINSFFGLQKISSRDSLLLDAISFYLPDFLWAYSLTFMLALFCEHRLSGVISSLFGVVWEIMQRIGAVSGTFDMIDILMYITASMFAVLILLFNRRKRI